MPSIGPLLTYKLNLVPYTYSYITSHTYIVHIYIKYDKTRTCEIINYLLDYKVK